MAKSWFGNVEEWTGPVPSGGYKCVIEEIEKGKTGEQAQTPGAMRYMAVLRVTEPKKYAGTVVRDYFTIGTEDDMRGREQETWRNSMGAKKLFRLLKRAGVTARDGDDEEWQDAAQGQEVCCHIMRETDDRGTSNRVNGAYFRESDEEFVGVGEVLEAPAARSAGQRSARGTNSDKPARAPARAAKPPVDEDDDEDDKPPTRGGKPPVDQDEDDDDDEAKAVAAKPAAKVANGKLKAAPKGGRKLPVSDDDDDDED